MKTMITLIIMTILNISTIRCDEVIIYSKSSKLITDQATHPSKINLIIESDEDIYGIQFDIRYNATELNLTEDGIVSKLPDVKLYSHIKENGIARVLMFGIEGEKLLDVSIDRIADFIDIQFKPDESFRGISVVELFDINLAGKAGIEIDLDRSSTYMFELSFKIPQTTSLSTNHPNPFNLTTTINYELSEGGMVSLIIYNMEGAVVSTLVEEYQKADYHNISWGGTNNSGQDVSSGRYVLKMSTPKFTDSITMTLLK